MKCYNKYMRNRVSKKVIENNKKYAKEIEDILNNITFTKIENRKLNNGFCVNLLTTIYCLFTIANIPILIYYLYNDKLNVLVYVLIGINLTFLLLISVLWIRQIKKIKGNKYEYNWYYLSDGYCQYQIWVEKDTNVMRTICNLTDKKILYVDKDSKGRRCLIRIDGETPLTITGLNHFLCEPEEIFPNKDYSFYRIQPSDLYSKKDLYKRKRVFFNNTYYYYPKLKNVIERFYPRGIKLKDDVIEYVCLQKINSRFIENSFDAENFVESYEYKFSLVNDKNIKIQIPEFVERFATKKNFKLPQQSSNIIYEGELNYNGNATTIEDEKEFLPLCDDSGNIIGKTESNKAHRIGALHKVIHIYVINNDKKILNVLTTSNDDILPDRFIPYIKVNAKVNEETNITAYKMANEVLYNSVNKDDIKFLFKYKQSVKNKLYTDNEFVDVYIINKDILEKNIILDECDFAGFKFIPLKDFFNKVENNYDKKIYIDKKEYDMIKIILKDIC